MGADGEGRRRGEAVLEQGEKHPAKDIIECPGVSDLHVFKRGFDFLGHALGHGMAWHSGNASELRLDTTYEYNHYHLSMLMSGM